MPRGDIGLQSMDLACIFGVPGSNNDLNVLARSHLFDDLKKGISSRVQFQVNENSYEKGYYLVYGIYPE